MEPQQKNEIQMPNDELMHLEALLAETKESPDNTEQVLRAAKDLEPGAVAEVELEYGDQMRIMRNTDGSYNIDRAHTIH